MRRTATDFRDNCNGTNDTHPRAVVKATREDLLSSTSQRTLWPADHSDAFCSHRTRAVNCLEWCGGQGFWKDRERRSGLSVWLAQRCITSALLGTLCTPVAYTSRTYTLICTCNYVDINRSFSHAGPSVGAIIFGLVKSGAINQPLRVIPL